MKNESAERNIVFSGEITDGAISCTAAGITMPVPCRRREYYPADEYVFEYVAEGHGTVDTADGEFELTRGMLLTIKKGANLSVVSSSDDPLESVFVNTAGRGVAKLFDYFEMGEVFFTEACVLDIFLEIHDKLDRMDKAHESDTYVDVLALLFKILSVAHRSVMFPSDEGEKSLAERVRGYIDANVYADVSLDVIAEELGISKIHVIRVFKGKYGIPPMQYMMTRKLEIAKSLLRSTVMPISEIAELLKFSNAQHFSGKFKSAVGCTPNKYRKNEK